MFSIQLEYTYGSNARDQHGDPQTDYGNLFSLLN